MARIRTIKPEFFLNDELGQLSAIERLFFVGMWTVADREGRMEDRPVRLKSQILPYDVDIDVVGIIDDLDRAGFITRYEVEGKRYIEVNNFTKHQRPHPREPQSTIPAPCPSSRESTRPAVERNGEPLFAGLGRVDKGKGMDKGKESNELPVNGKEKKTARATPRAFTKFDELVKDFASKWQGAHGTPYVPSPADRAQFGRLLRELTPEQSARLPEVFERYLTDTAKFLLDRSSKHSLAWLAAKGYNAYASAAAPKPSNADLYPELG